MASFCRSALMAGSRSIARSRALSQTSLNSLNPAAMASPFASATRTIPCATRFVSVLGCMESMMPLHSAIASARLTSNIAVLHHRCDKACWLCEGSSTEAEHEPNLTKQPCPDSAKLYCTAPLPCVPMAYKLLFVKRFSLSNLFLLELDILIVMVRDVMPGLKN
ncbi:hypothetical protein ACFX11_002615 [Malus domestica]